MAIDDKCDEKCIRNHNLKASLEGHHGDLISRNELNKDVDEILFDEFLLDEPTEYEKLSAYLETNYPIPCKILENLSIYLG